MNARRQEGGWSLLIILVALAIVAYLARDSLQQAFGTLTGTTASGAARLPPGAQPASNVTPSEPAFEAPVERARAIEDVVRKQAEQRGRQIDAPR